MLVKTTRTLIIIRHHTYTHKKNHQPFKHILTIINKYIFILSLNEPLISHTLHMHVEPKRITQEKE